MRHTLIYIYIIGTLLGLTAHGALAQVRVRATLNCADILIGEQVVLKAAVETPANAKVVFPDFPTGYIAEGVEVLHQSAVSTTPINDGKRQLTERSYTLTAFDSALYDLPALEVAVNGKTYRSAGNLGLKVSTVPVDTLGADTMAGPHAAVSGVYRWHGGLWMLSLLMPLALLGALAIAIRLAVKRPFTRRQVIKPPRPAHLTALESLRHMPNPADAEPTMVGAWWVQLTDTLRTYVGRRYHFGATELTTGEIMRHMEQHVDDGWQMMLRRIFSTADLVKFAQHAPSHDEAQRCLEEAVSMVEGTQQPPEEWPKPVVREVTLSERRQMWIRIGMKAALALTLGGALALLCYECVEVYNNFL